MNLVFTFLSIILFWIPVKTFLRTYAGSDVFVCVPTEDATAILNFHKNYGSFIAFHAVFDPGKAEALWPQMAL